MKAMILAAGRGTRLRPLTDTIPKPLLPIGGEPLIVHQLRWLARGGIRDVVINLHHLGEAIEDALTKHMDLRVNVRFSHEESLLDTGGGIKQALPWMSGEPFVLLNGDIWTNFRFNTLTPEVLARDASEDDLAHLVLTPAETRESVRRLALSDGRVSAAPDGNVYTGIAVLAPALFDNTPDGAFSLLDPLFRAIEAGRVGGRMHDGRWWDIGTREQLNAVRKFVDFG